MNSAAISQAIRAALAINLLLRDLGVEMREVIDKQDAALADGRDDLSAEEAQEFLDQAKAAAGEL